MDLRSRSTFCLSCGKIPLTPSDKAASHARTAHSAPSSGPSTQDRSLIAQFSGDERGAVAIIFAIMLAVVLLAGGIAIDYGRAVNERSKMQVAMDAAALAASHKMGLENGDVLGEEVAAAYFKANAGSDNALALKNVEVDSNLGQIILNGSRNVVTSLLKAAGFDQVGIAGKTRIMKGNGTAEIALVLDNSGSMAGQPIEDLRAAARDLVGVVLTGSAESERVSIGVVPFSGAVNVGAINADAAWMDTGGLSPVHYENFSSNVTRFQALSQMNSGWAGCVEARPAPHDTMDSPANVATPATFFVPMFAPDEPDSANAGGNSYSNNYLSDTGGSCPAQPKTCLSYSRRGNCRQWSVEPLAPDVAQARTCKYQSAIPDTSSGRGPNFGCTSQPILPLSTAKSVIVNALDSMVAQGYTNITEGLMWGWRVLSPEAPFSEGRPSDDGNNKKYLILMTDGANTYPDASNHNKSRYGSFGYGVKGRLGTTYQSSAYVSQMTEKTLQACANAKAAGIIVYTVAFRLENDPATKSLLSQCASGTGKAYAASGGDGLVQAFQSIGRSISQLRIAG